MIATNTSQADVVRGFNPDSKIWIYSSNRLLTNDETAAIIQQLLEFTKQWTSHNNALKASGTVLHNRFIVLSADDSIENPGGCSIDKSIHFIQGIEAHYGLSLFDRLTIFYQSDNEMKSFHFNDLQNKIASGEISENTLIMDTTITQVGALQSEFVKEAGQSWLARFIK